ncbi:MAG: Flagellar motor switch protein FliM [candidate division WS2 bacterium]|nr:Flagellar motor switch protein FliM [Candidatus Psychracetigena formicireducens]
MADVLSQKEIDSLLNAWTSGEIDVSTIQEIPKDKKVRSYDFRRPHKFSKDQLRTLQMIHENFSRAMASYLSGILRIYCNAEVAVVEPQTYHEFTNSLPEVVVLGVVDFNPLKKNSIIVELPPDISYLIVDRLLGGIGGAIDKARNLTEIEIALVERVIKQMLVLMGDSWANVIKAEFKLVRTETNAQFVQIVSPNETMAIITINVHIGDVNGMINVCIPHLVLEPIIENLSTKYWYSSRMLDDSNSKNAGLITKQIEYAGLDIKAELGGTSITVKDFLHLQQGDVIRLDNKIDQDIVLFVGGIKKFRGNVGTKARNIAVKITGIEKGIEGA